MINDLEIYLETIKNENTRNAARRVCKKLDEYMSNIHKNSVAEMEDFDVDSYIKRTLENKSATSILQEISMLKDIFTYFNNTKAIEDINLDYVKKIVNTKENPYFSPYEIYQFIENMENFQDKVLILLIYMGLYDTGFKTIRKIKESDLVKDSLHLEDGRVIRLNQYCLSVIRNTIAEKSIKRYSEVMQWSTPCELADSEYLLKTRARKGGNASMIGIPTLLKRLESAARVNNNKNITATNIKQSRIIYDFIKLELEENYGADINQLLLIEYSKDKGIKGNIGVINQYKKQMKMKVIEDIVKGRTFFID